MFNLGRILTGLATFAAVLVGAALGVPALMNWEHLRTPVEAEARALLGAPMRVDGRITVQLLPVPRVSMSEVVIEPGGSLPVSGDFARARAYLKIRPLLSGKAVPAALEFSGADLLVDREALTQGTGPAAPALPVAVRGGRVRFDAERGAPDIADILFSFSARAWPQGGARMRLQGTFEKTPFNARAAFDPNGADLRFVRLDFGEGQASLSYLRAESGEGVNLQMKFTKGKQAWAFLTRLLPSLGHVVTPEQVGRLAPLALALRTVPGGDGILLRGLEVTAGPLRLTGEGKFRPGPRPYLQMELGARTMVLGGENGFDPSGLLGVIGQIAEWGESLDGGIRLYADHVLAGGMVMRRSELLLSFEPEGTRLDRFRIDLRRGIAVSGRGIAAERGRLAAAARVDGARLEDLFSALFEQNLSDSGAQTPLTLEGQLVLSGTRAALNDVRIAAGRNEILAEGALFLGDRPALELRVEGQDVDLRPYGLAYEDLTSELSVDRLWNGLTELAAVADMTARIELGRVRMTDATLRDGVLDLTLDQRQLALRRLSIEETDGRTVEARLRMPFRGGGSGGMNSEAENDWMARAEAALDVRAAGHGLGWRAALWDGVLSLETETPVRSRLSGRLERGEKEFRWANVKGRIGRASVNAELSYAPDATPVIRGTVRTDKAAIDIAGGEGENLWPGWPLAAFWPRGVDIHLNWSADDLKIAGANVAGVEGTAMLEKNTARLVLTSGKLFGGAVTGSASLTMGAEGAAAWESQGLIQRADLAVLFGGDWQGQGTFRQSTSGSGKSIAEIVSGIRGTVGLSFEEGRFGGLDAEALAGALSGLESTEAVTEAVSGAFGEGATPFRRLEGQAKIGNGEVVLSGISAQGATGPIMLAGIVNLRARLIAAQADISLGETVGAPLSIQFIGRMEAPERLVDTERLTKRLTQ